MPIISTKDILETLSMINEENLDIRTITMGISLHDCVSEDTDRLCDKIYDKITIRAENLVKTGEMIEKKYGVPVINKRISVTPVSLIGGAADAALITKDGAARRAIESLAAEFPALARAKALSSPLSADGDRIPEQSVAEIFPKPLSLTQSRIDKFSGYVDDRVSVLLVNAGGEFVLKALQIRAGNLSVRRGREKDKRQKNREKNNRDLCLICSSSFTRSVKNSSSTIVPNLKGFIVAPAPKDSLRKNSLRKFSHHIQYNIFTPFSQYSLAFFWTNSLSFFYLILIMSENSLFCKVEGRK